MKSFSSILAIIAILWVLVSISVGREIPPNLEPLPSAPIPLAQLPPRINPYDPLPNGWVIPPGWVLEIQQGSCRGFSGNCRQFGPLYCNAVGLTPDKISCYE